MGKLILKDNKKEEKKVPPAEITFIKRPIVNEEGEEKKVIGIEYVALFSYFNNEIGMKEELPFKFKVDLENKLNVDYDVFSIDSLFKTMEFQLPKILDKETYQTIKNFGIRNIPIVHRIGFANRI